MPTVHTACAEFARLTDESTAKIDREIRVLQEHARAVLSDTTARPCPCDFYDVNPELHDELLGFEERGVAGVVWLGEYLEGTEESDPPAGQRWISWLEFPRFVSEHNWSDPLAVSRVAADLDQGMRRRRRLLEASVDRLEVQADQMDVKLAEIQRLVRQEAEPDMPAADLSPEHIAELVDGLPPALVDEIVAASKLAEELAWMAVHVVGRWEAIEEALSEAVGSDEVENGGDLVAAVELRTKARVTEEVLDALSLLGSLREGSWLEVLQGHALEPRDSSRVRFLEGMGRIGIAVWVNELVDKRTAEAVEWLLRPGVPEDEADQDVIDSVVMAARGVYAGGDAA